MARAIRAFLFFEGWSDDMSRSAGRRAARNGRGGRARAVVDRRLRSSPDPRNARSSGRWNATVTVSGVEIPFVFEIASRGETVSGSFFNGDRRITSAPARVSDGRLRLSFDQYAATLDVTVEEGRLTGEYRRAPKTVYPFTAVPRASGQRGGRRSAHRRRVDRRRPRATRVRRRGASSPANRTARSARRSCAWTATPAR